MVTNALLIFFFFTNYCTSDFIKKDVKESFEGPLVTEMFHFKELLYW